MIEQLQARLKALAASSQKPKILLFVNLPQDLDLLLPIAERLSKHPDYALEVTVSSKAWNQSPRIARLLTAARIKPQLTNHKATVVGLQPALKSVKAVIAASESTASAHKGPHTLAKRANRQGIATYTMQHGFDNVGLTYFDDEHPVGSITFASSTCFIWGKLSDLPTETPTETRTKCVAVGCPKFIDSPFAKVGAAQSIPGKRAGGSLVAVFENLHWSRYSDSYRQRFLQDLAQTALATPQVTFIVKPHHTGLWLTQRDRVQQTSAISNLIVADPKAAEWEAFTAPALIEMANAVITTPSTVAVDAARSRCPTAVVAYDLDLPNYEPLPLLRSSAAWQQFISTATSPDKAQSLAAVETFLQQRLIPGDAVERIVNRITADISRPPSSLPSCHSSPSTNRYSSSKII